MGGRSTWHGHHSSIETKEIPILFHFDVRSLRWTMPSFSGESSKGFHVGFYWEKERINILSSLGSNNFIPRQISRTSLNQTIQQIHSFLTNQAYSSNKYTQIDTCSFHATSSKETKTVAYTPKTKHKSIFVVLPSSEGIGTNYFIIENGPGCPTFVLLSLALITS